jgi:hypothetical protein
MFSTTKTKAIADAKRKARSNPDRYNGYVVLHDMDGWYVMSYDFWVTSTDAQYHARYVLQDNGTVTQEFDNE